MEELSDPSFRLEARNGCYHKLGKQVTQRESLLQTTLSELQSFADELRSHFAQTLSAGPAEKCAETERLSYDNASARVRRLLWLIE